MYVVQRTSSLPNGGHRCSRAATWHLRNYVYRQAGQQGCGSGGERLGPAGTRTIGAIPMIHRQNFIFKKTRTSRLIELIENSIEFVEISIESIESVESIFTRKSSS